MKQGPHEVGALNRDNFQMLALRIRARITCSFGTAVILSAAKNLAVIAGEILRCAQDDDKENCQVISARILSRLEDAEVLMANQRFAAAFYLTGYVVECGLKACIARQTREHEFPSRNRVIKSYTHDLTQLREVAQVPFREEFASDRKLEENWSLVGNNWSERKRYDMAAKAEAEDLLRAVNDPDHGVLQWLQRYW